MFIALFSMDLLCAGIFYVCISNRMGPSKIKD